MFFYFLNKFGGGGDGAKNNSKVGFI